MDWLIWRVLNPARAQIISLNECFCSFLWRFCKRFRFTQHPFLNQSTPVLCVHLNKQAGEKADFWQLACMKRERPRSRKRRMKASAGLCVKQSAATRLSFLRTGENCKNNVTGRQKNTIINSPSFPKMEIIRKVCPRSACFELFPCL